MKQGQQKTKEEKPQLLLLDTYLALIRNSVGTKMFQENYAFYEGKRQNLVEGGNLSCAYYVTFLLKGLGLIDELHLTVTGTEQALQKHGWKHTTKLKPGAIVTWESEEFDDGPHKHIGFFIGNKRAVSTSFKTQTVIEHSADFEGKRRIESMYWHPKLDSKD
jgi:hypothetical protein